MLELMAGAGFTTIGIQQGQNTAPNQTHAEEKVIAVTKAIRKKNPEAVILFYYTCDNIRSYSSTGEWFMQHPDLLLKLPGGNILYDWTQDVVIDRWASSISETVKQGNFDGVFIDGYQSACQPPVKNWNRCPLTRGVLRYNGTKVDVGKYVEAMWNKSGLALKSALPKGAIMIPNCEGGKACQDGNGSSRIPGYNGVMEEFFQSGQGQGPNHTLNKDDETIQSLPLLARKHTLADITRTDEHDKDTSIQGLAAFLVGAGNNQFYAAIGWYWQCNEIPIKTLAPLYKKPLGSPKGDAKVVTSHPQPNITTYIYERSFDKGTRVRFNQTLGVKGILPGCCIWWGDGTTSQCRPGDCS